MHTIVHFSFHFFRNHSPQPDSPTKQNKRLMTPPPLTRLVWLWWNHCRRIRNQQREFLDEKQLEFPLNAPQEDQTRTEPIEERPKLDSDPDTEIQAIQLAKFSSNDMSARIVPASSILVLEDPLSVFLLLLKFGVFESRKIVWKINVMVAEAES